MYTLSNSDKTNFLLMIPAVAYFNGWFSRTLHASSGHDFPQVAKEHRPMPLERIVFIEEILPGVTV